MQEKSILLPTAAVAEVMPFEKAEIVSEMPKWLLGILNWRGIHIPLVLLEKVESPLAWNGTPSLSQTPEERAVHIAIINRLDKIPEETGHSKGNKYPFFSILLKGMPKLHRISSQHLKVMRSEREDPRYYMEVKVQNDYALIPDLQNIWEQIDALPLRLQWFRQIVL